MSLVEPVVVCFGLTVFLNVTWALLKVNGSSVFPWPCFGDFFQIFGIV